MSTDYGDDPRSAAVEQSEAFGLSTYAARTYVALVGLGTATAKDVSEVADVPRTRVSDATAELRDLGLVDVQESTPREFWTVPRQTARRRFERQWRRRTDVLTAAQGDL